MIYLRHTSGSILKFYQRIPRYMPKPHSKSTKATADTSRRVTGAKNDGVQGDRSNNYHINQANNKHWIPMKQQSPAFPLEVSDKNTKMPFAAKQQKGFDMTPEGTLGLFYPQANRVTKFENLDDDIVKAFETKNIAAIDKLKQNGETDDVHVFVCVNPGLHAIILCVLNSEDIPLNNLKAGPDKALCWVFELCYENKEQRLYKIKREEGEKSDIVKKKKIDKAFCIGKYTKVRYHALQFAALEAAPDRYIHIQNDCVEFAKKFCLCLLSYCSNHGLIEEEVKKKVNKVAAFGIVDESSRNNPASGFIGNTFLGGSDASSFFLERRSGPVGQIVFFLIYTLVVSCLTAAAVVSLLKNEKMD